MKINKTKIIVPTLALAMGAALAGSVSGTVAWFQYSTRAQAAFIGTSAHCSESLEIQATAVSGVLSSTAWGTELTAAQVATATGIASGTKVEPVTSGAMTATGALPSKFYSNPVYQHFIYDEWMESNPASYYQFELHFHVKDINGAETAAYLAKNLYLTNLSIVSLNDSGAAAESEAHDLYKAVRVHINCGSTNLLFANDGTNGTTVSTAVGAKLDLNNDGNYDKTPGYEWTTGTEEKIYGAEGNQVANNVGGFSFANDANPSSITANSGLLGTTTAAEDGLKVTVTIWLEGWQQLATGVTGNKETTNSAVWDATKYIGKRFGVGFRFACDAHTTH